MWKLTDMVVFFLSALVITSVACTDIRITTHKPQLHDDVHKQDPTVESVHIQNEALLARFVELELDTKQLREKVDRLESENERILRRVSTLEADNESKESIIKRLTHRVTAAENELQALESVVDDRNRASVEEAAPHDENFDPRDKNNTGIPKSNQGTRKEQEHESLDHAKGMHSRGYRAPTKRATPVVAFFATISPHDLSNLGKGQAIIFDNAVTNVGNAYQAHRGTFVAQTRGLYMFSATIATLFGNGDWVYTYFMHNGDMVAQTHGNHEAMSGHTILLVLNPGDDVYIAFAGHNGNNILGDRYSSFSGMLIEYV